MVSFEKGRRKDEIAAELRAKYPHCDGVVFIGKAQEKCPVYRAEKRRNRASTLSTDRESQIACRPLRIGAGLDAIVQGLVSRSGRAWHCRELPAGFSNRNLRTNLAALRGQSEDRLTQGRGYRLTDFGFRVAVFCTRTHSRILRPGLGLVLPDTSSLPSPLRRSFDKLEREVNSWVDQVTHLSSERRLWAKVLADLINDGGPILHHGDREEQQRSVRVHLPEALEIPQSIQD